MRLRLSSNRCNHLAAMLQSRLADLIQFRLRQLLQLLHHQAHARVAAKGFGVAIEEIPVEAVERAGLGAGALLHVVAAALAVGAHPLDVVAAGGVGLAGQAAAVGEQAAEQRREEAEGEAKPKMSERQKALALGYAVPILSTAFAIILGLFIYDATRTNLDTWVWVLIIAIVGVGVIFGTRFAARARQARVEAPKPKTALAAGAATVNFVLSIVFGATVSIMSFTMGASAIDKLRVYPAWVEGSNEQPMPTVSAPTLQWWLQDMAPAVVLLLLAAAGIYLSITERHRKQNLVVEA